MPRQAWTVILFMFLLSWDGRCVTTCQLLLVERTSPKHFAQDGHAAILLISTSQVAGIIGVSLTSGKNFYFFLKIKSTLTNSPLFKYKKSL
jgi:hypothetical protein